MTRDQGSGSGIDSDSGIVYSISPEVVTATFDGRVVIYHLGSGRTLTLNQAAGVVFELIAGRCSLAEIRELLARAHPESAATVERDVDRTLRDLLEHGALESV